MRKLVIITVLMGAVITATGCENIAETGSIEGKVVSKVDHSAIPNAIVRTDPPTSQVLTEQDGTYSINGVNPGNYTVYVSASGFRAGSASVNVSRGNIARADFILEPGPKPETQGEKPKTQGP